MRQLKAEVTKFTIVGAGNFVVSFVVFTALLKILTVDYLVSLATAWLVGVLFSYVANFLWVFRLEEKIEFKARFLKFLIASVCSIVLNLLVLHSVVEYTAADPFFVQLALLPLIVVFNFSTAKFWSLRPSS
jgi:putative flippase GtrA